MAYDTMTITRMSSAQFRALRIKWNYSQSQLARRMNCNISTISKVEGGGPVSALMQSLMEAFDVIYTYEQEQQPK